MIKLVNLNKYYKSGTEDFHALKDINLEFGEKGMNFILGKSGSGKSTLLNIIGGIDSYNSGELIIDGVNTQSYTKKQYNTYRNTYIGFIFQEFNVLKGLNVYDNIAISLELQHLDIKSNHEKIQEIIDQVGLTGLENRMMNQLSGGQRQRVAIARSLIKNPRVIIADEPTGNLDSRNSKNIMELLKKLSKDRLVIIVTHSDQLASEYSERTIKIKDGVVIEDTNQETIETKEYVTNLVSVPTKTSLRLSVKSIFRNLKRFIFMIVLFAISLIFAGVVINMSLSNTTLTYAEYQDEYDNNVVHLVSKYNSYGYTSNSAFFNYQATLFEEKYEQDPKTKTYDLLKGMKFPLAIDRNAVVENEFYYNSINYMYLIDDIPSSIKQIKQGKSNNNLDTLEIYITDYVAENLIFQNYFGSSVKTIDDLLNKTLTFDNISYKLHIKAILRTTYEEHKESFTYFNSNAGDDSKAKNAFFDNSAIYNAIFLDKDDYELFFSGANIKEFTSNAVYQMVADQGVGENIKVTTWPLDNDFVTATKGSKPTKKVEENKPTQVAVTTGFFEKILNVHIEESEITSENTKCDLFLNKVKFELLTTNSSGKVQMTETFASNFLSFNSTVPANFTFNITTVVDNDEPIIYLASLEEAEDYNKLVSSLFYEGGFITLFFNNQSNLSQTSYNEVNSKLYRDFINNDINITNNSFTKVLLVDNFINDNLPLFLGVFFVFALFSVLLIFNFVIINIKNSTRDIGIYMSLGFSGWKISLIYLFQVLILGVVAYIISLIGTGIFLLSIDAHYTALSSVNLSIIKMSIAGCGLVLLIALVVPVVSVIFPLINLSRKNPVDVIKTI
ncbi:MAG: ABC transporter ATP-binding protein/permease [Bacilli bacterium]|nr:ABC transporter ATP-binding protein/permease [Bacilli bacterium]